MNRMKLFVLFSIVCLLFIVPTTFAVEDGNVTLESYDNSQVLTTDYYFDANVDNDTGDGSIDHPYKELTSNRIVDNSNIYLASGNYSLDTYKSIKNVTIIGANAKDTILKFYGQGFTVSGSLTLKDLTLNNLVITNRGTLNATNVIFNNNLKQTKGGAILCENSASSINLNACTFANSSATYGGAIYLSGGTLNIKDSLFMDTTSELFGGAISAINKAVVNIENSKFSNTRSKSDAGGAIYLLKSSLYGVNLEIFNSTADFGGAITSLQSTLDLNNFTGRNNKAKYDGGAIYAMYRSFTIINSILKSNQAKNGGAIYADNVESFIINSNRFISNTASSTAGGVYSLKSDCYYDSILDKELNNTFSNNRASSNNDVYESNIPDATVGSADYLWVRLNSTSYNGTLPVSYDMRTLGLVTPVKNQGSNGNCWAFAAIGALESAILKASGVECDLSEENMKNIMGSYSYYGWTERGVETNNGGFDRMAYAYFIGWLGPVNESDDTYKINSVLSPVLDSSFHIQNVLFFKRENYTDNDEIKRAVMEYGGLSTVLYMSSTSKNYKQYYNGSEYSDHAAVIVGWDDEMEIPNAPDKGAWIVKNSWGADWGDNGYFYVSYYDVRFAEPGNYVTFALVLNDTIRYDKNYQYDIPGYTDYYFNASNTVWYKSRFKATDNEYLAGVSTYFEKDTEWEVSIYVNGKLKHTQSGVATRSYKTIDLNQRIALKKGDEFEVVFKITVDEEAGFPICEPVSLAQANFTANLSFVSYDGKNWEDLITKTGDYSTHTYYGYQTACIKAFTILNKISTALSLEVVDSYNPAQFKATVKDQYGNLLKTGKVTFAVDGKNITVDVTDGIALLTYSFATVGNKTVTAKFSANGYNPSQKTITQTILPSKLSIGLTITTNVLDAEIAIKLSRNVDVTVYLNVDGKVSSVNVKNGAGKLSLKNLDYGTHTVKAYITSGAYTCQNVSDSFKINYISTAIKVNNAEMIYKQNYTFTLTLLDKSNNAVSGKAIVVNLNNKKYSLKTDSNGKAVIPTDDLIPGTYTADIKFAGRGIYLASNASARIVVNKLSTAITAPGIAANYYGGKNFYAYLKNANGEAVSGAQVKIVIGSISKTLTTNAIGRVSLSVDGLVPNNYTASVSFAGDQLYTKSSATSKVTINKINPNLTAVNVVEDYKGGKEIVATLKDIKNNPIVGAKVSIVLNGVKSTLTTDANGKVYASTDSLLPNTYVANITFLGNDIYKKFSITSRVVVNKLSTMLSAPIVNTTYNSGKNVVVTLKDTSGRAINGVNVKVTLDGTTINCITNSNGQVSLSLDDLVPSDYTAEIKFNGNNIYNPTSTTAKISISKADSNAVVKYSNGNLVATLKDPNGKAISGARIAFVIGSSKNYAVSDKNGQAVYSTASLADGSYTVKVGFFGNDLYKSSNQPALKFTVSKIATKLTVNNVAATYKSGKYILAVLKDVNNNVVSGAKIAFVVNGKSSYVTTDARGCARYSTDSFKEGSYDVKVGFFGNSIYKSSNQAVSKVVISKIATKLAVNNVATTYKSGKYILAVLKDASGKAIKGAKVCFVVNGKGNYVITDANGRATYSTNSFAEGSYDVKVGFFGNDTYKASNQAVSKVVISKIATSLAVSNVAATYKSGKYILALLKDASGKAIKGAKICFVVNGKSYYVLTDTNGKARLSIDIFAVGSYSVKVGYFGNSTYKASNQAISKVTISR